MQGDTSLLNKRELLWYMATWGRWTKTDYHKKFGNRNLLVEAKKENQERIGKMLVFYARVFCVILFFSSFFLFEISNFFIINYVSLANSITGFIISLQAVICLFVLISCRLYFHCLYIAQIYLRLPQIVWKLSEDLF